MPVSSLSRIALVFGAAATALPAVAPAKVLPDTDYLTAPFRMERILDHGSRPDWSPDGRRLAFTESDERDTPAYEIDLADGNIRCLTCHLGKDQAVTRIYYLADGSFLLLAPRRILADGTRPAGQELYWMAASLGASHALGARAFGEIAISREADAQGTVRLAWGDIGTGKSLLRMATLSRRGDMAELRDQRTLYDSSLPANLPGVTVAEAYGFANGDKAVTFYTIMEKDGTLDGEMVQVNIASGELSYLYRDPSHNETHLFPDERYALEESNRASDPAGRWRGLSSHPASFMAFMVNKVKMPLPRPDQLTDYAPHGQLKGFNRPFDLYVVKVDGSAQPRRLTRISHLGAEAHQSVISPDGRRIAFSIVPHASPEMAGKGGLYVGTFGQDGPDRKKP